MATHEWYAVEVSGTVTDLTANLNAVETQGFEIFSVVISPRGWTVIARKGQAEQKPVPIAEPEKKTTEAKSLETPPSEAPKVGRGTVVLHRPHKK